VASDGKLLIQIGHELFDYTQELYPEELKPNSGAFAFPNEGIHITVLYDRLVWSEKMPGFAHVLLAHVLVHEITHLLEGICRHSTWDHESKLDTS